SAGNRDGDLVQTRWTAAFRGNAVARRKQKRTLDLALTHFVPNRKREISGVGSSGQNGPYSEIRVTGEVCRHRVARVILHSILRSIAHAGLSLKVNKHRSDSTSGKLNARRTLWRCHFFPFADGGEFSVRDDKTHILQGGTTVAGNDARPKKIRC